MLLAFLSVLPSLWARSGGAPIEACSDLMPQHGNTLSGPNNGFFLTGDVIDDGTYVPGETYEGNYTIVDVSVKYNDHCCTYLYWWRLGLP